MSIRENISAMAQGAEAEASEIEYHLESSRELYDGRFLTADRHSSRAGQWVVYNPDGHYSIRVVTYPTYQLPQELCLRFKCLGRSKAGEARGLKYFYSYIPYDEFAFEIAALLTVFSRSQIKILGARRIDGMPVKHAYASHAAAYTGIPMPARAVDTAMLVEIIENMSSADEGLVHAIMASAKLYHGALGTMHYDISGAYSMLVYALECLAGFEFRDRKYTFEETRWSHLIGDELSALESAYGASEVVAAIKSNITKSEYLVSKKYRQFLEDYISLDALLVPDPDRPQMKTISDRIDHEKFLSYAVKVYEARSKYVHEGKPFPSYAAINITEWQDASTILEFMACDLSKPCVPPILWFERLVCDVLYSYMREKLAPRSAEVRRERLARRKDFLKSLDNLSPDELTSIEKIARWTAQFVDHALVGPMCRNRNWCSSPEVLRRLVEIGVVSSQGDFDEGSSSLRDREVAEFLGDRFWGVRDNPFRGTKILPPAGGEM